MAQDWDIRTLGKVCSVCENAFEDQQSIYSCLFYEAEEGYKRMDICEACWTDERRDQAVSYWKTVYHAPPPPAPEPVKRETAESLLRQYMSKEDFSKSHVIFILAVMLERKRVLVERDVKNREDGVKIRVYEHRKTGEMFTVPDPELKLTELEDVQTEVNELLGIPPRKTEAAAAERSEEQKASSTEQP